VEVVSGHADADDWKHALVTVSQQLMAPGDAGQVDEQSLSAVHVAGHDPPPPASPPPVPVSPVPTGPVSGCVELPESMNVLPVSAVLLLLLLPVPVSWLLGFPVSTAVPVSVMMPPSAAYIVSP
jgi:hypothetical protein